MSTLDAQLEIEENMVGSGIQRYLNETAKREEKGSASETSYGASFIKSHIVAVATEITRRVDLALAGITSPGSGYWKAMANMDAHVLAFITLRCTIDAACLQSKLTDLTISIGKRIEDEVRLRQFEQMDKDGFDKALFRLKQRNANSYHFKLNSMVHAMNFNADGSRTGIDYFTWPVDTKIQIGANLLDAAISATGHFEKTLDSSNKKTVARIKMSQELEEWVLKHKDAMAALFPVWMPTVVPPREWTSLNDGGFYSPAAQSQCNFVIMKQAHASRPHVEALEAANLSKVYSAVNFLQKTSWAINTDVLDVAQQVWELGLGSGMPSTKRIEPPAFPFSESWTKDTASAEELSEFEVWKFQATQAHTREKERIGKCALVSRILVMAESFKQYPELYFVWHCDFRSRMYSVASGLAPQSADLGKAMLKFGEAKPLGDENGIKWFKVHGANTYGVDKVSYADRVRWVDENSSRLCQIAADPISHRAEWENADKPYQFLAWVFEYAMYCASPETFKSALPIAQDGTCNGLQHYSAMLRDEIGGTATNLVDSDKPSDIYGEVAAVVRRKLESSSSSVAAKWLEFGIDRSVCKRPVMTLPYGSTQQSCRDYLLESYFDKKVELFDKKELMEAVNYLSKIVWEAIGEVVVAARAAMNWLQQVASALTKKARPIKYTAPSGFIVYQDIRKLELRDISTVLCGRTRIKLGTATDKLDPNRQRNGIAPNFVHSCDASHLVATIIKAEAHGITHVAAIHDDYGVHACDSELFARLIRESFVEQYSRNILRELYDELCSEHPDVTFPEPPSYGSLDLEGVLHSKYFFG